MNHRSFENLIGKKKEFLENFSAFMSVETEKWVSCSLISILSGMKKRKIQFDDSMGIVTVAISLRNGKHLVITSADIWLFSSKHILPKNFKNKPYIRKIQELIGQYETIVQQEFKPALFALKFDIYLP